MPKHSEALRPVAERKLTRDNIEEIDNLLDAAGVFAKPYWRPVDGRNTVIGLRIGQYPNHVVARFGDTIVRHADGTHSVRAQS